MKYDYEDGKLPSKISIRTPQLFSWGIQENGKNTKLPISETNPVENYTMSFVMFNKERIGGPSEDESKTIDMFEAILTKCQNHLKHPSTKAVMGKYNMDPLVDMMSIFYRKHDKGQPICGYAPTLYPKLYTKFQKTRIPGSKPEILTGFYTKANSPIDPTTLVGVKCNVIGEIIIDNIYIGSSPYMQVKLNDAIVVDQFSKQRRLFMTDDDDDTEKPKSVFSGLTTMQRQPETIVVTRPV